MQWKYESLVGEPRLILNYIAALYIYEHIQGKKKTNNNNSQTVALNAPGIPTYNSFLLTGNIVIIMELNNVKRAIYIVGGVMKKVNEYTTHMSWLFTKV